MRKLKLIETEDFIGAGFKKIDDKYLEAGAPKVDWDKILNDKTDEQKLLYLKKFASSMNYAASMIQRERDELGKLCKLKEKQLIKQGKGVEANNAMLQQEVTRMNEQRQGYNAEVKRLNGEIRKLKG